MSMLLKAGFAHVSPDTDLINDGNNIELVQTDTKKIWILKKSEYTQIKSVVIKFRRNLWWLASLQSYNPS